MASELFLRWREEELSRWWKVFLLRSPRHGVLQPNEDRSAWMRPPPDSPAAMQLSMLAQATIQTIERYYLAISLLLKAGSGVMTQKALEQQCQLAAQRMNMLYGFNSPEFFDRALFENFIDLLRERGVFRRRAKAAIWNSTRCWCASPPMHSSFFPNRYATASCRSHR